MAWFMIVMGFALLVLGLYRIFSTIDNYQGNSQIRQINKQAKKQSKKLIDKSRFASNSYKKPVPKMYNEIENQGKELEKNIKDHYKRLRRLNSDMGTIINELSWKEKSIKRSLDNIKTDLGSLPVTANKKVDNEPAATSDSFQDIFNKSIVSEEEEKIPDKYLEIFKLYDLGMTPDDIAEEMDIGVRETELIFKLYGRGANNAVK